MATTTTPVAACLFDNLTLQEMVRDDSRVEEAKSVSLEETRRQEKESRLRKKTSQASLTDSSLGFERNQAYREQEAEKYRKARDVSRRQREGEGEARLLWEALSVPAPLLLQRHGSGAAGTKDGDDDDNK